MKELSIYRNHIQKLCEAHNVKKLYGFGSITEKFNAESDVDFVVDFKPFEIAHYADNYYPSKFSLEDILKRPIDLPEEKALIGRIRIYKFTPPLHFFSTLPGVSFPLTIVLLLMAIAFIISAMLCMSNVDISSLCL